MKRELTLRIDGEEITLTARREGESIRVERGEESYLVTVLAESIVGLQAASRQPTGTVSPAAPGTAPRSVTAGVGSASAAAPVAGPGAVVSPMTGVIDQVLVAEGATVAEGEKVVILEAMKMYIDVMAPGAGTVSGVSVKAGDNVKEGQLLLTIT